MHRLNKDFKNEVDEEFREGSYVARKALSRVAIAVVTLSVIGGIGKIGYTKYIEKQQINAEREVFKSSVAYTEEAASFIAKSYKEYNDADNSADKKAIMEYVSLRYPNLDTDAIENDVLRNFYNKCIN